MKVMGRDYMDRVRALRRANDIQAMATEIADHIPNMWRKSPNPGEFWYWFSGELESVLRNASTDDERERLRDGLMKALNGSGVPEPPASLRMKY